ncbi:hypothetical protein WEH80_03400 [Actinomycetes bacterium KLBMP 9759]
MNIDRYDDDRTPAVMQAQTGATSWRSAVNSQQQADSDHGDWYAIAGEMVDTLRCLSSLTTVLAQQIGGYGQGRVLRDDDPTVDPAERITDTVRRAEWLRAHLDIAERSADDLWSLIGHIAVEVDR